MTVTIIEFVAHPQVHQATGMISVRAHVDPAKTMVWLRSTATRLERPIDHIAADLVARRIRFDGST